MAETLAVEALRDQNWLTKFFHLVNYATYFIGYVCSLSYDPVDVWPRIRQSESTLAFYTQIRHLLTSESTSESDSFSHVNFLFNKRPIYLVISLNFSVFVPIFNPLL